jgi:hypothetical protein
MMSLLRALIKRFWLCLGLALVIAGGTAATMGYLAAREAAALATLVAAQPTTKPAPSATTKISIRTSKKTAARKGAGTPAPRKTVAAAPSTRAATPIIANANAPAAGLSRWRGMMWWGGGVLAVGMVSVAYSIHEMRPKEPPTGADELLNDAPPF